MVRTQHTIHPVTTHYCWLQGWCCLAHHDSLFISPNWNLMPWLIMPRVILSPGPGNHLSPPSQSLILWIWPFQMPQRSGIRQYLSVWIWFISLSVMSSKSTHAVTQGRIAFFLRAKGCIHWIFCISSPADGHSGCFHILAVVNSAAMTTGVLISPRDLSVCYFTNTKQF